MKWVSRFDRWLDAKRTPNGVVLSLILMLVADVYQLPGWIVGWCMIGAATLLVRDFIVTLRRKPRRCKGQFYFGMEPKGKGLQCWKLSGHDGDHAAGNRLFPVRWSDA